MDVNRYINKTRNMLKNYCVEECKSYCCRNGYLIIDEAAAKLINANLKKINEMEYSLNLKGDCPCLVNFKFKIYKNSNRPTACQDFPIFVEGKTIKLSNRCLAVKSGKFFGFVKKMNSLGYEIKQSGSLADSDFFNLKI